jgi:hypothetical protein
MYITRNQIYNVLNEIDKWLENDQFLLHNGLESWIVLFSTKPNLEFLLKSILYILLEHFSIATNILINYLLFVDQ